MTRYNRKKSLKSTEQKAKPDEKSPLQSKVQQTRSQVRRLLTPENIARILLSNLSLAESTNNPNLKKLWRAHDQAVKEGVHIYCNSNSYNNLQLNALHPCQPLSKEHFINISLVINNNNTNNPCCTIKYSFFNFPGSDRNRMLNPDMTRKRLMTERDKMFVRHPKNISKMFHKHDNVIVPNLRLLHNLMTISWILQSYNELLPTVTTVDSMKSQIKIKGRELLAILHDSECENTFIRQHQKLEEEKDLCHVRQIRTNDYEQLVYYLENNLENVIENVIHGIMRYEKTFQKSDENVEKLPEISHSHIKEVISHDAIIIQSTIPMKSKYTMKKEYDQTLEFLLYLMNSMNLKTNKENILEIFEGWCIIQISSSPGVYKSNRRGAANHTLEIKLEDIPNIFIKYLRLAEIHTKLNQHLQEENVRYRLWDINASQKFTSASRTISDLEEEYIPPEKSRRTASEVIPSSPIPSTSAASPLYKQASEETIIAGIETDIAGMETSMETDNIKDKETGNITNYNEKSLPGENYDAATSSGISTVPSTSAPPLYRQASEETIIVDVVGSEDIQYNENSLPSNLPPTSLNPANMPSNSDAATSTVPSTSAAPPLYETPSKPVCPIPTYGKPNPDSHNTPLNSDAATISDLVSNPISSWMSYVLNPLNNSYLAALNENSDAATNSGISTVPSNSAAPPLYETPSKDINTVIASREEPVCPIPIYQNPYLPSNLPVTLLNPASHNMHANSDAATSSGISTVPSNSAAPPLYETPSKPVCPIPTYGKPNPDSHNTPLNSDAATSEGISPIPSTSAAPPLYETPSDNIASREEPVCPIPIYQNPYLPSNPIGPGMPDSYLAALRAATSEGISPIPSTSAAPPLYETPSDNIASRKKPVCPIPIYQNPYLPSNPIGPGMPDSYLAALRAATSEGISPIPSTSAAPPLYETPSFKKKPVRPIPIYGKPNPASHNMHANYAQSHDPYPSSYISNISNIHDNHPINYCTRKQ